MARGRSAYQTFVSNYMKGRASSNFRDNASLMREAAAAWRSKHGGGRGRRNPSGGALAVRENPGGGMSPLMLAGLVVGGGYLLGIEPIKSNVDKLIANFKPKAAPAATT